MKKKNKSTESNADFRRPASLPDFLPFEESPSVLPLENTADSGSSLTKRIDSDSSESELNGSDVSNTALSASEGNESEASDIAPEDPDRAGEPDLAAVEEYDRFPVGGTLPPESEEEPVPLNLASDAPRDTDDKEDIDLPETYVGEPLFSASDSRRLRTQRVATPGVRRKKKWLRPVFFVAGVAVVAILAVAYLLFGSPDARERLSSPLTVKDQRISNAEFSFVYHYVLIENGIDIYKQDSAEQLAAAGEDGFTTYRDYFLDMAAREIQVTQILYDDAVSKGYSIDDSQRARAQAYLDWLQGKAKTLGVSLDTYIQGYFGDNVTQSLILDTLSKKYFTEDYAGGPKLDELKASDLQAEDAYSQNAYQYDLVNYRVLRIVFDQTDDSYKATAHLRAQEIIDGIGHDQSRFESVAAQYFTGEAQQKLLTPDSTLVKNVRYASVTNADWQAWLFDTARQPGDCTIFNDDNGFPILVCFSSRTRQTEPLRDVRLFSINRENTDAGQAGVPDTEIMPLAQSIFDSITDESSVQTLETTYADEINAGKMKAAHNSNTYSGVLPADIDAWVFDPARKSGDKTIIETDTQVILVYYVGASPNPEWYDRVNSFIRMNNYQAFLLEEQTDYPYTFSQDGLKYIKDTPNN